MAERVDIVSAACALLGEGNTSGAAALLAGAYPPERVEAAPKGLPATEALRVFQRDGFVDRYSGRRLLFPGVLRVLSAHLPIPFPYQPNGRDTETHLAYWELFPVIDHVRPMTRGGLDAPENWVTTSMLRHSAKAGWTLEDLGWWIHPAGNLARWDGLQSWFMSHMEGTPKLQESRALRGWYQAVVATGSAVR
jgi:hypothetical protein